MGKSFRGGIYTSSFRSLVRKIGIFHFLFRVAGKIRQAKYAAEYKSKKPSSVGLSMNGRAGSPARKAFFIVESLSEFMRVRAMGSEKKILSRFLEVVGRGDIVYDIGASIGLYTVWLSKAAGDPGEVFAFEPESESRERLLQNLALNSLANVKVFDVGLGDKTEKKSLVMTGSSFASGAHGFFYEKAEGVSLSEAAIAPGDKFASEMGLPLPNAIKVDVEGYEYEVLLGLRGTLAKTKRCAVLVEVHFGVLEKRGMEDAPKKIERLFELLGFRRLEWLDYSHLLATKNSN